MFLNGKQLRKKIKKLGLISLILLAGCGYLQKTDKPKLVLSIHSYLEYYPDKDVPNKDLPILLREKKKALSLLPPILQIVNKEHKELTVEKIRVHGMEMDFLCYPTYNSADPYKKIKVLPVKMDYGDVIKVSLPGYKDGVGKVEIDTDKGKWEYPIGETIEKVP
ncbi:Hypothetical protein Minf_0240 [Methylacidiphilum infernorum V4]|uniref:Lipoprotein n=1 Tax=Methylacidiphilum infernorum (isolate V4) TaxID=481448 RepID=B3DXR6_METI4|nr:Hypothetical protein Minf_0240 [Methylacidiphilum infernorum V4]